MATYTKLAFNHPDAIALADYTGIARDLQSAIQYAKLLLAYRQDKEERNSELIEPLCIATLVRYCRPFSSGVRSKLDIQHLSNLTDEQITLHEYLRTIRDKHIAHSVNCYELNQTMLQYCVERLDAEGYTHVVVDEERIICLSVSEITGLIEIAEIIIKSVTAFITEEKKRILQIVKNMPISEVQQYELKGWNSINSNHASKPRIPSKK
ncbi:MAG: hypothetical protein H3C28_03410 [Sphingomonadales bacterium]|nr:hypothetical protein [Sphingomonadales bacterium]